MRALRRLLSSRMVQEYNNRLLREARELQPDLFLVFKGALIKAETIRAVREMGTLAIQYFPDVSFRTHGPHLPGALQEYDWVFTTKTFGLNDMSSQLGVRNASLLPHGYDPETHSQHPLANRDRERYGCDVSFIGDWSPKKEDALLRVASQLKDAVLRIWGPRRWAGRHPAYMGQPVFGVEYAKAVALSRINLALLSEQRRGASDGDQVTTRTFEIPAAGGFMLHERTQEVLGFFDEGHEIACFGGADELLEKVRYYLLHEPERCAIAVAGRARCLSSGYSLDDRVRTILRKYVDLRRQASEQ